jgi:hypothetical protein
MNRMTNRVMIVRLAAAYAAASFAALPAALAAECRATSPASTVALIELYTSEGCDSCPPADRWFSTIDLGGRGTRAVALAFHVDYWDRQGWKDRFSEATYTDRQYEQMRRQRTTFVYTPQVLVQGHEFSQWRSTGQPTALLDTINARPARATIDLAANPVSGGSTTVDVHVRVPEPSDRAHASVAVALVQSGLNSEVKAGENAGKHLSHDHVVRQWHAGLAVNSAGEARERLQFTVPADAGPLEIVAFAEDAANGDVLQALSLPLCTK